MNDAERTIPQPGSVPRCPDLHLHTPCPDGYIAWHEWAERTAQTHDQKQCPSCGLWAVWVPKEQP